MRQTIRQRKKLFTCEILWDKETDILQDIVEVVPVNKDKKRCEKSSQMANLRRKIKLLEKMKRYRGRRSKRLADCVNIFNEKNISWSYICMYCMPTNMILCISFKCIKYQLGIRYSEGNIS